MNDDRLERFLRGYRLPEPPLRLDRRILKDADRILFLARLKSVSAEAARVVADALGFGYITWLYDVVSASGAEHRVEFI
jgi:hypothetical protein